MVEKYIEDCITSIISQLVENVEIILINDGTTDDSMEKILEKISVIDEQKRNQFVLINQANQGQSVARNNAIKKAKGEYIGFIDSDDVIAENYFENILNIIENYEPDIIRFKYATFSCSLDESIPQNIFLANEGLKLLNNEILINIFNDMAWFSFINVIKKSFFDQNKFPIGVYFEDVNLISKIFTQARNIYFLNETLYFYRFHKNSSIRNVSANNILKLIHSHKDILKEIESRLQKEQIYSSIFVAFSISYFNLLIKTGSFNMAIKQHFIFKNYKKNIDIRYLTNKLYINYYYYGLVYLSVVYATKLYKN